MGSEYSAAYFSYVTSFQASVVGYALTRMCVVLMPHAGGIMREYLMHSQHNERSTPTHGLEWCVVAGVVETVYTRAGEELGTQVI